MKLISRESYLSRLRNVQGTPDIKVITGIRRSGKSKLMEALIADILERNPDANIIHINFNLTQFESIQEYHALEQYVSDHYIGDADNVLMIDEVQMCKDFERAINSLHASERYDIYLTGSNAFLLSSDLATLFTGRTFAIEVFPFSFSEYIQYYPSEDIQQSFDQYTREGGMAGSYLYKTESDKYSYISDVFDTLIVRDIRNRYKIRNQTLLDKVGDFMMDNISNIFSLRSVSKNLCNEGMQTNDRTIGTYVKYLCQAFAFYRMRRYDIRGRKYLSSQDKYYLADHSLRYARLGTRNMDFGRVYENIVAMELLRRGYEVYIGVLYKKEIDFVAIKQDQKIYIQVSDDISNSKTLKRETDPLFSIKDAYPKYLIARTRHEPYDYQGVQILDLPQWLIAKE